MIVEQCMSKSPRTCAAGDTLSAAARLLWDHDLGALPVVDAAGAVVGMLTDRDVCMAAYTSGQPLHACTVGRHMSRTVFSIGAKAEAAKAAELMKTRKVRRLPVVENGRLVGIVTLSDLSRRNGRSKGLDSREIGAVLAVICEPRAPAAPLPGVITPKPGKVKAVNVKAVNRPKPRVLSKKR